MGTDIHAYAEIKIDGEWHYYNKLRFRRNYEIFYLMAGVRGPKLLPIPISLPKGLPNDISHLTEITYEHELGMWIHSASWFNLSEIKRFYNEIKKLKLTRFDIEHDQIGYLFGNSYADFDPSFKDHDGYPKQIEDVRWIFWFDN